MEQTPHDTWPLLLQDLINAEVHSPEHLFLNSDVLRSLCHKQLLFFFLHRVDSKLGTNHVLHINQSGMVFDFSNWENCFSRTSLARNAYHELIILSPLSVGDGKGHGY